MSLSVADSLPVAVDALNRAFGPREITAMAEWLAPNTVTAPLFFS